MTRPRLLDGLLWHEPCGRPMTSPTAHSAVYACVGCGATVPAVDTEQTVTLGALIRASAAIRRVGRPARPVDPDEARIERALAGRANVVGPHRIPRTEVRAWMLVDPKDSAAALRVAFSRIEVSATGQLRKTWRYQTDDLARAS